MTTEPVASGHGVTDETSADSAKRTRPPYGWASIAIAIIFGLLYAYVLWGAIGDLISLPASLGSLTPWWLLILAVAVPVVAYVAAFILGFRRSLGARTLFLFIGFAVVACSTVDSIAYIQTHYIVL
jgi:hypothetical protein